MVSVYRLIRPALRRLPPETAHELTLRALELGASRFLGGAAARQPDPPALAQRLWGLDFPNPVGLAAGYDKDARVPDAMLQLGFGFVEVGTVTRRPQPGNPQPRVFRLEEDQAIINRMGFNSGGLDAVVDRLSERPRAGIVGVNLGRNRDTADAVADYAEGLMRAARLADYLVVNVSSPNTPGLRELQGRAMLATLLSRLVSVREESACRVPLLVKIAPDLTLEERGDHGKRIGGYTVRFALHDGADVPGSAAKRAGSAAGRCSLRPPRFWRTCIACPGGACHWSASAESQAPPMRMRRSGPVPASFSSTRGWSSPAPTSSAKSNRGSLPCCDATVLARSQKLWGQRRVRRVLSHPFDLVLESGDSLADRGKWGYQKSHHTGEGRACDSNGSRPSHGSVTIQNPAQPEP
jgi:hypothetical protein